jgi:hypothetical protein
MDPGLAASRRPGMAALIFEVVSTLTRNTGIEIDPLWIFFFEHWHGFRRHGTSASLPTSLLLRNVFTNY